MREKLLKELEEHGKADFSCAVSPLLKPVEEDRVHYEEALQVASHPQDFRLLVQSLGFGASR